MKTGKRLGKIDDCHNDCVKSINFSKKKSTMLLAGSDDGHLVHYDLGNESLDEVKKNYIQNLKPYFSKIESNNPKLGYGIDDKP